MNHEFEEESAKWSSAQMLEILNLGDEETEDFGSIPALARDLPALRAILEAAPSVGGANPDALLSELTVGDVPLVRCDEIKEAAKVVVGRARDNRERLAAMFLYHAAIAVGIASHGEDRTSRDRNERWPLYCDLAAVLPDPQIANTFRVAADRLLDHIEAD